MYLLFKKLISLDYFTAIPQASFVVTNGADTIVGTSANETFDGIGGGDTFVIGTGGGLDTFHDTGTSGKDRIVAQSDGVGIGLASGFGPNSGIEQIAANGHSNVFITGSNNADVFDFSTVTLSGIQKIVGGIGADKITGSLGNDDIRGDNDADSLRGNDGNDTMFGGSVNDMDPVLNAQHGRDGNDTLDGGNGDDQLAGGADNDLLLGGAGVDSLYGANGNDTLSGGGGNDLIYAEDGNDLINASGGLDTLSGAAGLDTFRFSSTSQTSNRITDFTKGRDKLDFSLVDANSATAANDTFLWGGKFTGAKAHSITYSNQNGITTVYVDVDGNTTADMTLTLTGTIALASTDFLL